jgi:hypothetical protein
LEGRLELNAMQACRAPTWQSRTMMGSPRDQRAQNSVMALS